MIARIFVALLTSVLLASAAVQMEPELRLVATPVEFIPKPKPWRPVFDEDGVWLVESNFDHAGHWEWQKALMECPDLVILKSQSVICR